MLTKRESNKIIKALPLNGYQLVSEKLNGEYSAEHIRKVLNGACTVKYNKKIVDAALQLIEEDRLEVEAQKQKIKQLSV